MSDSSNIVDLDQYRIRIKKGSDDDGYDLDLHPLAYFEAVWSAESFGWNTLTVDMEAYRKGQRNLPLRQPETTYEYELIIRHLRGVANDLCRQQNLLHLVHPEDDI